ncbi:MAG: GGDEF domain-containing response regulator [Longimicrobiales bacterium]
MHQRPLKVLLVVSDPEFSQELRGRLGSVRESGIVLETTGELASALARLAHGGFDAALLDLELPDSQGMVTFERTRAFAPDVPVVVLSDEADEELAVAAVQGGAQDFLLKSELQAGLLTRALRYAIERHRLLSALRSLSLIDDLTGLYNRRGFRDLGEQYLKLARRAARGVTLVYLDLDRFKTINDTLGHHVGDRALRKVADILRTSFRRSDILARLGGDEFAVLALESSEESADLLIDRLREGFRDFNAGSPEPYQLNVSVGMAQVSDDRRVTLDDLLEAADTAMYAEKRGKQNAVVGRA